MDGRCSRSTSPDAISFRVRVSIAVRRRVRDADRSVATALTLEDIQRSEHEGVAAWRSKPRWSRRAASFDSHEQASARPAGRRRPGQRGRSSGGACRIPIGSSSSGRRRSNRAQAPIIDDPFMLGWGGFGLAPWFDFGYYGFYSPLYGPYSPYYYSPFAYPYYYRSTTPTIPAAAM
jgi:hypothetical protein